MLFQKQQIFQSKIDFQEGGASLTGFPITLNILSQDIRWSPVFWENESDISLGGLKRSNIRGYDITLSLDYNTTLEPDKITAIIDTIPELADQDVTMIFYPDASDDDTFFEVVPTSGTQRAFETRETISTDIPTLTFENKVLVNTVAGAGSPTLSGGDADTLNGLTADQFLRSDTNDTFESSNILTIAGKLAVNNIGVNSFEVGGVRIFDEGDEQKLGVSDDVSFNSITGDGSGLTLLDASNITQGELDDGRLSSNVPLKNVSNTWTGLNVFNTPSGIELGGTGSATRLRGRRNSYDFDGLTIQTKNEAGSYVSHLEFTTGMAFGDSQGSRMRFLNYDEYRFVDGVLKMDTITIADQDGHLRYGGEDTDSRYGRLSISNIWEGNQIIDPSADIFRYFRVFRGTGVDRRSSEISADNMIVRDDADTITARLEFGNSLHPFRFHHSTRIDQDLLVKGSSLTFEGNVDANGTTVINSNGELFYSGQDTDNRYGKLSSDNVWSDRQWIDFTPGTIASHIRFRDSNESANWGIGTLGTDQRLGFRNFSLESDPIVATFSGEDFGVGTANPSERIHSDEFVRADLGYKVGSTTVINFAGTLLDTALSSNVPLKDTTNTWSGINQWDGGSRIGETGYFGYDIRLSKTITEGIILSSNEQRYLQWDVSSSDFRGVITLRWVHSGNSVSHQGTLVKTFYIDIRGGTTIDTAQSEVLESLSSRAPAAIRIGEPELDGTTLQIPFFHNSGSTRTGHFIIEIQESGATAWINSYTISDPVTPTLSPLFQHRRYINNLGIGVEPEENFHANENIRFDGNLLAGDNTVINSNRDYFGRHINLTGSLDAGTGTFSGLLHANSIDGLLVGTSVSASSIRGNKDTYDFDGLTIQTKNEAGAFVSRIEFTTGMAFGDSQNSRMRFLNYDVYQFVDGVLKMDTTTVINQDRDIFGRNGEFDGSIRITHSGGSGQPFRFEVSDESTTHGDLRSDARWNSGDPAIHRYWDASGGSSGSNRWREAWYDGSFYHFIKATPSGIEFEDTGIIARDGTFSRNLFVEGGAFFNELVSNTKRVFFDNVMSQGGGKISVITDSTQGAEVIEFEDETGVGFVPVEVDDILHVQRFRGVSGGTELKNIWRKVASISGNAVTLTDSGISWTAGTDDVGSLTVGDSIVQKGNTTDATRQSFAEFLISGKQVPEQKVWEDVTDIGGGEETLRVWGLSGFGATGDRGIAGKVDGSLAFEVSESRGMLADFEFEVDSGVGHFYRQDASDNFVGLQSDPLDDTKAFFAGADDKTGTNALFFVQNDGKIFHSAIAHSLFTRESVGAPAPALTSLNVLSLSAIRSSVGTTTEEEIKVRRRYFHRDSWDEALFTFYCRAEENEASGMIVSFRQQVLLKVFSVNSDGSTNTELLSGSRIVPVQGTFTERDITLDLSSLSGNTFYEIQIILLAEVEVQDQQGTNSSDCETFLREDFDIIVGT